MAKTAAIKTGRYGYDNKGNRLRSKASGGSGGLVDAAGVSRHLVRGGGIPLEP